jgi:intracellular multiplication protein IcmT
MSSEHSIQWRYSAMKVRIGPFDALVVVPPLLLFLMHIRWWTFSLAIGITVIMWIVELYLHMPLGVVYRSLRSSFAGSRRSVVPWWKQKRL